MKEDQVLVQENTPQQEVNNFSTHPVMQVFPSGDNASGTQSYGHHLSSSNLINLVPYTFQARPEPISLSLTLASSNLNEPSSSRHSAFNTIGVA